MQFSAVAVLSLLGSAVAVPASLSVQRLQKAQEKAASISWSVTNWNVGCGTTSSCTYSKWPTLPTHSPSRGKKNKCSQPNQRLKTNLTLTLVSQGFNIEAPAYSPGTPAFQASCNATTSLGAPYQSCNVVNATQQLLKARIEAGNATDNVKLAVSYEYVDTSASNIYWNYTSFATEPYSGVTNFSMTPTQVAAAG